MEEVYQEECRHGRQLSEVTEAARQGKTYGFLQSLAWEEILTLVQEYT